LLDDRHPLVIELSEILNQLPIHTHRPDEERFRNPNGVALKLANFAALDPDYEGAGMSRGGRRDAEVWDRYHGQPGELGPISAQLRAVWSAKTPFPISPEEDEDEVEEGRLLYRRHRARERDRSLVQRKKRAELAKTGRLACEACGFEFGEVYGELGQGFIEAHHLVPLAASGETTTRLSDLALLCSNCHRMAHRHRPWPSAGQLRALLKER
jgi:5-methylcytosine-specific restriction protein A